MIKKKAYAKLNLNLHIIPPKDNNDYYQVRFISTQLALHDELSFETIKHGIEVVCDHKEMPQQEDNLVYKAAVLLQKLNSKKRGIKVKIKKNIPIRAGLGGGSSDAAVAINTLSELWNIRLTQKQRTFLASILGKDVHYSLTGGIAEIGGDGDRVMPLSFSVPKFWLVIIVPEEVKPSTSWMYKHINETKIGQHIRFLSKMKKAIKTNNKTEFFANIFNDFEEDVLRHFPITLTMKQDLVNNGALKTLLCGSGLAMAGFFDNKRTASRVRELLIDKYKDVLISQLN